MLLDRSPSQADSDALFDEWDKDQSGQIEYKELWRLLRGLGPRGPRAPLWAAKAPRVKHDAEVQGGVVAGTMTVGSASNATAVPDPTRAADGARPTPDAAQLNRLAYSRSEAVMLGELPGRRHDTMALSRKRVATLNNLTDSVVREAEREMERLEIVHRLSLIHI